MKIKKKNLFSDIGAIIVLTVASLFVMIPVLWMVSTSLKEYADTVTLDPQWIPENISIDSYILMWQDYPFLDYFGNSIFVVVVTVIVAVSFSCLAGYGATRFRFIGKNAFVSFLLITQMFPSIMLLVPYYKVLSTYNLTDTLWGLVLVHISFTIPFCSWMMIGFFRTIPQELDEAAMIDGCNRFQTFWRVILPVTLPGIASSAIYAFITSWNEYMFARTLIVTETMKTVPVAIGQMNGYYKILWNDLMAASMVASIPLILGFIFFQRYFISGLTAGAVKS